MGSGHDHGTQALNAGGKHRARRWWAAALLAVFMVVEAAAAILPGWPPSRASATCTTCTSGR